MSSDLSRPDPPQPAAPTAAKPRTDWLALLPGLGLCAGATALAMVGASLLPGMSALLLAILLGVLLANTVPLTAKVAPGIAFAAKRVLRVGVVLLGLQLVLGDILSLGVGMIAVVVAIVGIGIGATLMIGKWMGISLMQRLLIACGFSVCGAAAVAAVDGVVDAEEEEVLTAIAMVVLFGTLMIPLVPLAAELLGLSSEQAGLWAGGSIHEVAQVVAAGGTLGTGALALAVIVKLARVLMLAPVMMVLSWQTRRATSLAPAAGGKRPPLIPLFVLGFLAMVLIASTGWVPAPVLDVGGVAQTVLLAAAMFALGCGVKIRTLLKVGGKPLLLGVASTVVVASVSLGGILLVS